MGIVGAADGKNRRAFLCFGMVIEDRGTAKICVILSKCTQELNKNYRKFSDDSFNLRNTGGLDCAELSPVDPAPDGLKM